MATTDKLALLRQTKEAFRTAITGKGQTISADEPFSAWPAKIEAIPVGGGQLPTLTNPGTADDLAKGKELIDENGNVIAGNVNVRDSGTWVWPDGSAAAYPDNATWADYVIALHTIQSGTVMYRAPATVAIPVPFSDFGDAQPSDVAAGKIFTSASGLRVPGTGSGGGGNAILRLSVGESDTATLSVSNLPATDYAYLLDCDALMVVTSDVGTSATQRYILGGMYSIGTDVDHNDGGPYNFSWGVRGSAVSTIYNSANSISVTRDSLGISVYMDMKSGKFSAGAIVTVVGLKI